MGWKLKEFHELSGEDIYKLIKLRIEVFVVEQKAAYQDCDGKDLKAKHLFLEENDEIVACLRILERGVSYEEASIGRIVVKRDLRGNGIAQDMINRAINYVKDKMQEDEIRISAQAHLEGFYGGFGFKKVSGLYLEDGIPHVQMLYSDK